MAKILISMKKIESYNTKKWGGHLIFRPPHFEKWGGLVPPAPPPSDASGYKLETAIIGKLRLYIFNFLYPRYPHMPIYGLAYLN